MAENERKQVQMIQKTLILGTDHQGNTTYKINFYQDGRLLAEKNNVETYAIEVVNKEGVLIRYELNGNVPDGDVVEYYENGALMVEKKYLGGQKNGAYKLYYPSGNVWKEGRFRSDQMIRLKTYAENGILLSDKIFAEIVSIKTGNTEVFYKMGREIGKWTYNEDGTIIKEGEIIDGIVKYYVGKTLKEEHIYDEGTLVTIKTYNKKGEVVSEKSFIDYNKQ